MDVTNKDASNPFHHVNGSGSNGIGLLDPINGTYTYDTKINSYADCHTGIKKLHQGCTLPNLIYCCFTISIL